MLAIHYDVDGPFLLKILLKNDKKLLQINYNDNIME